MGTYTGYGLLDFDAQQLSSRDLHLPHASFSFSPRRRPPPAAFPSCAVALLALGKQRQALAAVLFVLDPTSPKSHVHLPVQLLTVVWSPRSQSRPGSRPSRPVVDPLRSGLVPDLRSGSLGRGRAAATYLPTQPSEWQINAEFPLLPL